MNFKHAIFLSIVLYVSVCHVYNEMLKKLLWGLVAQICDPSTWETGEGGELEASLIVLRGSDCSASVHPWQACVTTLDVVWTKIMYIWCRLSIYVSHRLRETACVSLTCH